MRVPQVGFRALLLEAFLWLAVKETCAYSGDAEWIARTKAVTGLNPSEHSPGWWKMTHQPGHTAENLWSIEHSPGGE